MSWDARDYHRNSGMQQRLALEVLGGIDFRGDERVLDIGCGDGKVTAEIARRVPRGSVLGIDSSEEMVRFAREGFPPAAVSGLAFEREDATRLPYRDEFDLVLSFATLHWIADHLGVLRGVQRGLRPGGRLVMQCGGRGNLDALLPAVDAVLGGERWQDYFRDFAMPWSFYGVSEYQAWLPEVGLAPRRVDLVPKRVRHAGEAGLAAWLRTTWLPYLERVPESSRSELAGEIAAEYARQHPADGEGAIHVPMMRLEVEAAKE